MRIFITLMFFTMTTSPSAQENRIVSLEKDVHKFRTHISMRWDGKEIVLLKNTNALCNNTNEGFAGKFKLKSEFLDETKKKMLNFVPKKGKTKYVSPHLQKLLVNGSPVKLSQEEKLRQLIKMGCNQKYWIKEDVFSFKRNENSLSVEKFKNDKLSKSSNLNLLKDCQKNSDSYLCQVKGYGVFVFGEK